MVGASGSCRSPEWGPITLTGEAVREGFPEEVALSEGALVYLQQLSIVQRLDLGLLPGSQDCPNPNPSAQPVNKSMNICAVGP